MKLQYSKSSKEFIEIEDKLKELSLAYNLEKMVNDKEIYLIDGTEKIAGLVAILSHLQKLEGDLHKWYYCDC